MQINQAGLEIVKRFEGLRLKSYKCPADVWTIGYGTTTRAGVGINVKSGMEITEAEAEAYLVKALDKFGAQITSKFTRTPTSNQYSAMLSLAYNIGAGAFKKSTCLKRFNAGDMEGAAEALTWFNKAGGKTLNGLVRRRAAERELFLADDVAAVVTPTPDAERETRSSKTLQAAGAVAVSGVTATGAAIGDLSETVQIIVVVCLFVLLAGCAFIARERIKAWAG